MKHIKEYEELTDFTKDVFGLSLYIKIGIILLPEDDKIVYYNNFVDKINSQGINVEFIKDEVDPMFSQVYRYYVLDTGLDIQRVLEKFPPIDNDNIDWKDASNIEIIVLDKELVDASRGSDILYLIGYRNKTYKPF